MRILDEVVSRAAGHRVRTHAKAPWERTSELEAPPPPPGPGPGPEPKITTVVQEPAPAPDPKPDPTPEPAPGATPTPPPAPAPRKRPPARIWAGSKHSSQEIRRKPSPSPPPSPARVESGPRPGPGPRPGRKEPAPEPAYERPPLPSRSGGDRIVLLARDPFIGHAYWELSSDRIQRAITELGGSARGVLRLIDIEHGDTLSTFDVLADRGRYVLRFPAGDRRYSVELGLEAPNGRVAILLRSNAVLVPPCLPRERGDVLFVDLEQQRAVVAKALDTRNPPRLVAHYPNPSRMKKPPKIHSIELAQKAALYAIKAELERDASSRTLGGGSEPRLVSLEKRS